MIAHYLGQTTIAADALAAAFRIPNVLQNLLGEGVLSASFIPEYARLRKQGKLSEARQLAGAVLGLLSGVVLVIVAIGVTVAPWLVGVLVPGFDGSRRTLAIALIRILFPGVGALVLSAWCLGVLNSHGRFFLSYAAPVIWNVAIIAATVVAAARGGPDHIVIWIAWGAALGSLLQFLVQLPPLLNAAGPVWPSYGPSTLAFQAVRTNMLPAVFTRGVVQISAFLDAWIASWLPLGSVAALANSQLLYTLPISLFGMSIAASELPAMAEDTAHGAGSAALIERLKSGSARIAFFVVPTSFAFVALGHQVAGVVFQSGAFSAADARWVWGTLAGAAIGLLPQAWGRLLNSAHYALGDTRTPLRFATFRVALSVVLGAAIAFQGPRILGIDPKWGTVGLAFGTAVAGTLEWFLLRRSLISKLGPFGLASDRHFRWWGAAAIATVVGVATYLLLPRSPVLITGPASLGAFGVTYLAVAWALGIPEVRLLGLNRP